MKVSEQWLREWVSPQLSSQELADQITMAGLEVDGVEPVAADFTGVVVAEVIDKAPHPDADKLNVCRVDDGSGEVVQVVCGAPNVAVGQRIPFAQVGAMLPGDFKTDVFKIRKARLRGVESFGMICSASELGLEEGTSEGILVLPEEAPVGTCLREYLNLDDHTIEVDLTPNRGDCLSVLGLAREVGVLNRMPLHATDSADIQAAHDQTFPVRVEDAVRCPRYIGRVIKGVDIRAATPGWMVERLRRSGIRAIDPVVDVTNYVMLELGQPLHAFDLANLHGGIAVRPAAQGEELMLLDGRQVKLDVGTLIIADDKGPLAIAGIMGGEHSGVNAETRDILLEAAFFTPLAVAGQARSYSLHTDASHRFERGVDPEITRRAIERASQLLIDICGGQAGPVNEQVNKAHLPERREVSLTEERLAGALSKRLDNDEVTEILQRLGMDVAVIDNGWRAQVPSWRFDISIEEDLIEEVARIHGYNRLPTRRPAVRLALEPEAESRTPLERLRRQMIARGYQEAITYSFVAPELQKTLLPEAKSPVLANPISADLSVMRASLFPGLIGALEHNLNRQQSRVRLFESGLVFRGELDQLEQIPMLGALACGSQLPEGWTGGRDKVDFFDLKGDLESLLGVAGDPLAWRFESGEHPALHPGQSARVLHYGKEAGWIGALHPATRARLGLKADAILFEVRLDALTEGRIPAFAPLSRYPEVRRDLAFVVAENTPVQALMDAVRSEAGEWLTEVALFDVYRGKGVADQRKSVALGLTWQHPSRTLNDEEINQLVSAIVTTAGQRLQAELRA